MHIVHRFLYITSMTANNSDAQLHDDAVIWLCNECICPMSCGFSGHDTLPWTPQRSRTLTFGTAFQSYNELFGSLTTGQDQCICP